jgi:ribosomal protein S18 acetylase RimI-like enzyme
MQDGADIHSARNAPHSEERRTGLTPVSRMSVAPGIRVELYEGERQLLRSLFQLAEDSKSELDRYIELGHVLVARLSDVIVGHIQFTPGETSEILSVAVLTPWQRQGIGTTLICAALAWLFSGGAARVLVGTAAVDIDNVRLYRRLGFRFLRLERDAFTAERGYAMALNAPGLPPNRDRVWFVLDYPTGADEPRWK